MKKFLIVGMICLMISCPAFSSDFEDCLDAIHMVESGGRMSNVPKGDSNRARGPFQIWKAYWQDAIQFDPSIGGTYADCENYDYSKKIVVAYLNRYCPKAIDQSRWDICARIHNGGNRGYLKSSTLKYWTKVKKFLDN